MDLRIRHVILDRDGVLDAEPAGGACIRKWSEWHWLPGALAALAMLHSQDVLVSVATNQSGVGRGSVAPDELEAIHARMIDEAAQAGGAIHQVFVCPHAPQVHCRCRKPEPGLLLDAMASAGMPGQATIVVGDDLRDLEAARAAGLRAALVRTGKGRATEALVVHAAAAVFDDLRAFATAVLAGRLPTQAREAQ